MKITIQDLLPEELSDESAYHLVNFFMNLSLTLESHYFVQMRRYLNQAESHSSHDLIDPMDAEFPS